ncbi:hypothetical protein SAMN05216198_1021 [Halopseudomonas litoralis]|uniref:Lipoprotein n=1 Tax=Halopseudomonas litoralis TaxID=797277 RepID=A0A1H1NVC3_9GAMM|nr:hypothetical protein [Halopseudomonas litoralis]SDS02907.1 hypothetical protein SAMN05216198_1021 [Halopseudomonas litoralis]
MDRVAMEFIARRCWRRAEAWVIGLLLIVGGGIFGYQISQWTLAKAYMDQVSEVRNAYDEAIKQRDIRLDALTRLTGTAASKATEAAVSANQAAGKADEAINRLAPEAEQ